MVAAGVSERVFDECQLGEFIYPLIVYGEIDKGSRKAEANQGDLWKKDYGIK